MQELDWDSSEWIWWGPWHQAPSSAPALLQESRKLLLYPHHLDSSTFVTMLMKLPASWHISFHSGHQDSVEKYIPRLPPQLWLKQGTNPIPSPVNSSWDPNPLDCFIYLQNTVNLKAPYDPTLWQSLTFGWGGVSGGQQKQQNQTWTQSDGERYSQRDRQTERVQWARETGRRGGREGAVGGISWHAVMYKHQPFSQTTEREREERVGQEKEEPENKGDRREDVERLSLDVLLPLICLNVTDRHTARL